MRCQAMVPRQAQDAVPGNRPSEALSAGNQTESGVLKIT